MAETADLAWRVINLSWTLLTNLLHPEVEEIGHRRDCRRQSRSLSCVSAFFARFPLARPPHPHRRVGGGFAGEELAEEEDEILEELLLEVPDIRLQIYLL